MLWQGFDTRLARVGLVLALVAISTLSMLPVTEVPVTTYWDKLDHCLGFFVLAFLANHAFPQRPFWHVIAVALVAYGIGIEVAQSFTPDRQADGLDVLADSVGILSYGLALQLRLRFARSPAAGSP